MDYPWQITFHSVATRRYFQPPLAREGLSNDERLRRVCAVCRPQFYEGFAVQIQQNWRFEVTNLVMTNIAMV